ncbi:MAG: hypothetical protein COC01_06840 [Bacteroidetes bacterium]|nr:MAG: hypothetical protein COC01_06840 [Bacteroidota bacterium]
MKLEKFYKEWLGQENFYEIILNSRLNLTNEFNQSKNFLTNLKPHTKKEWKEIVSRKGDVRIDIPVWFGDLKKSKRKLVVIGLEPRDTNSKFNVERKRKKLFGSPYGIDRWNDQSSIIGKAQNKYFRVFKNLVEDSNRFVLFTDVVKEYEIVSNQKSLNDKHARETFNKKSIEQSQQLIKEINIVSPDIIITLGNDAYSKVVKLLGTSEFNIKKIRHPSFGGENQAIKELNKIVRNLN